MNGTLKIAANHSELSKLQPDPAFPYAFVAGKTLPSDGGEGIFRLDTASELSANGGTVISSALAQAKWVRENFGQAVNVAQFGVKPGDADCSTGVNAAIQYVGLMGGGYVDFGPGTYAFLSQLVMADGVRLRGLGAVTVWDFTGVNDSNGAIYGAGELESLGLVGENITVGDRTVEFDEEPDLEPGDIYMVFDSANGSYNPGTAHYKAGEFFIVQSVSGTTVTNTSRSFASYTAGGTRGLYKLNSVSWGVEGAKMLFRQGVSNPGIKASLGANLQFKDLELSGSRYTQIFIDRCFNFSLKEIDARDYQAGVGLNYGILIGNSQNGRVSDCNLETTRHGLSHGGGAEEGCVPYRGILISNCHINCTDPLMYGLDFHANGEHCHVSNSFLYAGSNSSADQVSYSNCTLWGNVFGEAFFQAGGALGANYHFDNCTFIATMEMANGCLVSLLSDAQLVRPTVTSFTNCHFQFKSFLADSGATFGVLWTEGVSAVSDDITVRMTGCDADSDTTAEHALYAIGIRPQATRGIKNVVIQNNAFKKAGIWLDGNIQNLTCDGNTVLDALDSGIRSNALVTPSFATQWWSICGNKVFRAKNTGMYITGTKTAHVMDIKGNTSLNNVQGGTTGSTLTDSSLYAFQLKRANVENNTFGDDQAVATQTRGWAANDCDVVMRRNNEVYGGLANTMQSVTSDLYRGSAVSDVGSIADGATATVDVTVPGVALGDIVSGSVNLALPAGVTISAKVTGTNAAKVMLTNHSGGPYDPDSATYSVIAHK